MKLVDTGSVMSTACCLLQGIAGGGWCLNRWGMVPMQMEDGAYAASRVQM